MGMYAQMMPVVRSALRDVERKKCAFVCISKAWRFMLAKDAGSCPLLYV